MKAEEVLLTIDTKIRERYPHMPPSRPAFETEAAYVEAVMRYFQGQAELTDGFLGVMPSAAISTLHDGSIVYANSQAQQLLGLTPSDLARHRANDFLYDAEGHAIGALIGRRVAAGEAIRQEAVYVKRPDSRCELRMLTVSPVFAPGTQTLVRAVGLFYDPSIAERENESLRALNRQLTTKIRDDENRIVELEALAFHDDMTGVMNKRSFAERARPAIEEERRRRGNIALFFFDPDEFKEKNDLYGHRAGDELIREIAGRLCEIVERRYQGQLARYGGDEFCALFRAVDPDRFQKIADDLSEATRFEFEARNPRTREMESFPVTVSIGGVLRAGGNIPDLGDLLEEADAAMFDCKNSGRGSVKTKPYVLRFPRQTSLPPKVT